ncbi:MAG: 8-oxo-dGTP diphosphatase MutT [Steroidobacteraceae bacterium]
MNVVRVVAAALVDPDRRVLIAERPAGKALSGQWEFPGGKLEPGESEATALARELAEELGIEMCGGSPWMRLTHEYPDRIVELSLWIVAQYRGEPRGLEGQAVRWVSAAQLAGADILAADRPFVAALVEWLGSPTACEGLDGRPERHP